MPALPSVSHIDFAAARLNARIHMFCSKASSSLHELVVDKLVPIRRYGHRTWKGPVGGWLRSNGGMGGKNKRAPASPLSKSLLNQEADAVADRLARHGAGTPSSV